MDNTNPGAQWRAFTTLLLTLLLLASAGLSPVLAYEREIPILGPVETKEGPALPKGRLRSEISYGYGLSYAQTLTGLYGVDDKYQALLARLGQTYSNNMGAFRFVTAYETHRTGLYLGIPFGVVEEVTKEAGEFSSLFEDNKYKAGLGDVYAGAYYVVSPLRADTTNVTLSLDVNAENAEYSSLGDGTWDYTGGIQARKMINKSTYLMGLVDYTTRSEKNGVKLGNVFGYGAGVGFVKPGHVTQFVLKAANIGETEMDGSRYYGKDEDLALIWRTMSTGGMDASLTIANLDEGVDLEKNSFGFEWTRQVNWFGR